MNKLESNRPLAKYLGELAVSTGLSVTTAESCTGGGVAHEITRTPGSSARFELGVVTYSNAMKTRLLGVPEQLLATHGAVSEEVVGAMAEGVHGLSGADCAVAISGIAGPDGGTPEKPVGTVCFGWVASGLQVRTATERFPGDRDQIRSAAVSFALERLIDLVKELSSPT